MSATKVLTAVDLIGIQRFIFSSNRLADVTGASHLVNLATPRPVDHGEGASRKVRQALSENGALHSCGAKDAVIVTGGGNAVLEFSGENAGNDAKTFAARYSRWLIDEAPGLEAVIVHEPYDNGFAAAVERLFRKAAKAKAERAPSVPLLGLSVTASCAGTGLPASEILKDEPVSKSIRLIRDASEDAKRYWNELLLSGLEIAPDRVPAFPTELDDMGRTEGRTSLIAIVHLDGNGVGKKISAWLKNARDKNVDDAEVKQQYRKWSGEIDALGETLMKGVVQRIASRIVETKAEPELRGSPRELSYSLHTDGPDLFLPLRPVILGGDDITFLCDGRIALDLAVAALDAFRRSDANTHLGPIGACAGVAIVHAHAPILRAWSLAEQLCRSAKKRLVSDGGEIGFALDWHIGLPAPGESIDRVRVKQYESAGRRLTCRPLLLGDPATEATTEESWKWLSASLLDDGEPAHTSLRGPVWRDHKNKVQQLPRLIRIGPEEVEDAIEAWRVVDARLRLPDSIRKDGFVAGQRTPLLDASELLDVHLSLEAPP